MDLQAARGRVRHGSTRGLQLPGSLSPICPIGFSRLLTLWQGPSRGWSIPGQGGGPTPHLLPGAARLPGASSCGLITPLCPPAARRTPGFGTRLSQGPPSRGKSSGKMARARRETHDFAALSTGRSEAGNQAFGGFSPSIHSLVPHSQASHDGCFPPRGRSGHRAHATGHAACWPADGHRVSSRTRTAFARVEIRLPAGAPGASPAGPSWEPLTGRAYSIPQAELDSPTTSRSETKGRRPGKSFSAPAHPLLPLHHWGPSHCSPPEPSDSVLLTRCCGPFTSDSFSAFCFLFQAQPRAFPCFHAHPAQPSSPPSPGATLTCRATSFSRASVPFPRVCPARLPQRFL